MTEHAAPANAPPPLTDDGPRLDLSPDNDAVVSLAHAFVKAFNDRDADGLVALAHSRIVFRPTALVGRRRTYHGHAGLRRWVTELEAMPVDFRLHIREIRPQRPSGFLVLSTLHVGEDLITDSAMIAALCEGRVIEAHSYLSDEGMLVRLGLIVDATSPLA